MKFMYALGVIAYSLYVYKSRQRRQEHNLILLHSNSKLAKFYKLISDHFLENYADGLFYSGHAQTFLLELLDFVLKFFKTFTNFFDFKYNKEEKFILSDGGTLIIHHTKCSQLIKKKRKNKILVVIPGFTSEAEDYYIKNFLNDFVNEYDCRVMNVRGIGTKLTSPQMVSTKSYLDVREYLDYCCKENPDKKIFAVGFSYGGMLLARCLGNYEENSTPSNLIGGCGICYPMCLESVKNHVESQLNGFYSKYGALNLKKCFMENLDVIFDDRHSVFAPEEKQMILYKVKNLQHVAEFDEIYTYKLLRYNTVEDYYQDSKLENYIGKIKIPFLSIFTKDDPIIPYEAIPLHAMKGNPNLITVVSKKGGHMGFFKGLLPQRWIDIPIKTFIKTVNILHDIEERENLTLYSSSSNASFLVEEFK